MARGRNGGACYEQEDRRGARVDRLHQLQRQRIRQQVQVKKGEHQLNEKYLTLTPHVTSKDTEATEAKEDETEELRRHMTATGYLYTVGLAALSNPKVEMIILRHHSDDMLHAEEALYGLAIVVKCGRDFDEEGEICTIDDEPWQCRKCSREQSRAIRKMYATECDKDATFLLLTKSQVREDGTIITWGGDLLGKAIASAGKQKTHLFQEFELKESHHRIRYHTDTCDHCGKGAAGGLLSCAGCDAAMYCSPSCQRDAWETHKEACRETMRDGIRQIWNAEGAVHTSCGTKQKFPIQRMIFTTFNEDGYRRSKGMFLRHLNGDFQDNKVTNLALCHPHEAFTNPGWEVDWWCGLSKAQQSYVKKNMSLFAEAYEPQIETGRASHDQAFERMSQLRSSTKK